jgi:hypothetical protein
MKLEDDYYLTTAYRLNRRRLVVAEAAHVEEQLRNLYA